MLPVIVKWIKTCENSIENTRWMKNQFQIGSGWDITYRIKVRLSLIFPLLANTKSSSSWFKLIFSLPLPYNFLNWGLSPQTAHTQTFTNTQSAHTQTFTHT